MKTIKICNTSEFSTFSESQLKEMKSLEETKNLEWHETEQVKIVTFDSLIKRYGTPSFCKIDVEGYEKEVLKGLSKPIENVSFEYNSRLMQNSLDCVDLISRLGKYEFNYSIKESMKFSLSQWVSKKEIKNKLLQIDSSMFSFGDIYARLK